MLAQVNEQFSSSQANFGLAGLTGFVFPKIESTLTTRDYGRFIISPMEQGYGATLGNSLRRVLISSLEGAAIVSVRMSDVHHEFSDIPFVKEDVMQVMLNLKQIRVKMQGDIPMRMRLQVRGEGTVTAGDIETPPELEIVNPDLYLFTTDSPKANLSIEFAVERGRGYSPAEKRLSLALGELPLDAIYSPIRRVNFEVESARVGQMTNYDRLILEIWTDGTLRPNDALSQAANLLMMHLGLVRSVSTGVVAAQPIIEEEPKHADWHKHPIENLNLSVRVFNALKRSGLSLVGEVVEDLNNLDKKRNLGQKSITELVEKLIEYGIPKELIDAKLKINSL